MRISLRSDQDRVRIGDPPSPGRAVSGSAAGKHAVEVLAGGEAELEEDLVQVVLDRLVAD